MGNVLAGLIAFEDVHHLGAGEQPVGDGGGLAGRNGPRIQPVIGLIGLGARIGARAQILAVEGLVRRRHHGRHPVFVGDADPAAGGTEALGRGAGFLEVVILGVDFAAVRHPDKAFMQDPAGDGLGNVLARDIAVREQIHRRAALVGDAVGDREHVFVVDGDGAGEDQAMAIVPAQDHRMARRQDAAIHLGPFTAVIGHVGGADPAELRIIGIVGALGGQQHDLRRFGIDRVVILLQAQIVDARALEQDGAVHHRGVDRQALAADLQRRRAAHMAAGVGDGGQFACRRRGRGLLHLPGKLGLARLFGLHGRRGDEILPQEQHRGGQRDGQKDVFVAFHDLLMSAWANVSDGGRDRSRTSRPARKRDGSATAAGW